MYNSEDMLREEVYDRLIEEFGVTIAVAQILGYAHIEDEKEDYEPIEYRSMKSQLDVNWIISESIETNKASAWPLSKSPNVVILLPIPM